MVWKHLHPKHWKSFTTHTSENTIVSYGFVMFLNTTLRDIGNPCSTFTSWKIPLFRMGFDMLLNTTIRTIENPFPTHTSQKIPMFRNGFVMCLNTTLWNIKILVVRSLLRKYNFVLQVLLCFWRPLSETSKILVLRSLLWKHRSCFTGFGLFFADKQICMTGRKAWMAFSVFVFAFCFVLLASSGWAKQFVS